jgi:glucosamine--fructose-6-phosphate aminotransferase (isomerizing)
MVKLGGLESVARKLKKIRKFEILACGTSYYSGLVGELLLEEISGIPTEVILASEYRYRKHPVRKGTGAIFISQSGETADTLAALRKANQDKLLTLGVVNAVGSSIARETIAGVYNHAGPEIGVASTKAFLSQLGVLSLMSLYITGKKSRIHKEMIKELAILPSKIGSILKESEKIKSLAKKYLKYGNFLYLGRGYNYPTALEGALKLKEISYVHAEGYAGGEMKHGPIALIDKNFPTIALATKNKVYEKMISNLEEIKARSGPILAIATKGDKTITKVADDVFYVPKTIESLEPILNIVPLQLFAYYFGTLKGYDVDKPRNLAKSVTVE